MCSTFEPMLVKPTLRRSCSRFVPTSVFVTFIVCVTSLPDAIADGGTVVDVGGLISIVACLGTATWRWRPWIGCAVLFVNRAVSSESCLFQASGLAHWKSIVSPPWERPWTITSAAGAGAATGAAMGAAGVGCGDAGTGAGAGEAMDGAAPNGSSDDAAAGAGAGVDAGVDAGCGANMSGGFAVTPSPPPIGAAAHRNKRQAIAKRVKTQKKNKREESEKLLPMMK